MADLLTGKKEICGRKRRQIFAMNEQAYLFEQKNKCTQANTLLSM